MLNNPRLSSTKIVKHSDLPPLFTPTSKLGCKINFNNTTTKSHIIDILWLIEANKIKTVDSSSKPKLDSRSILTTSKLNIQNGEIKRKTYYSKTIGKQFNDGSNTSKANLKLKVANDNTKNSKIKLSSIPISLGRLTIGQNFLTKEPITVPSLNIPISKTSIDRTLQESSASTTRSKNTKTIFSYIKETPQKMKLGRSDSAWLFLFSFDYFYKSFIKLIIWPRLMKWPILLKFWFKYKMSLEKSSALKGFWILC